MDDDDESCFSYIWLGIQYFMQYIVSMNTVT